MVWSDILHINEVCINGASEQKHLCEDHLLTIVISGNSTSVENLEISQPVHPNVSLDEYIKAPVMIADVLVG